MRFLRIILWILLLVGLIVAAQANWHDVMIDLWNDQRMAIKLPLLVAIAFAAGLVPAIVYYRARIWRLNKRLDATERNLAARPLAPPPPHAPRRETPREPDSPFEV